MSELDKSDLHQDMRDFIKQCQAEACDQLDQVLDEIFERCPDYICSALIMRTVAARAAGLFYVKALRAHGFDENFTPEKALQVLQDAALHSMNVLGQADRRALERLKQMNGFDHAEAKKIPGAEAPGDDEPVDVYATADGIGHA